MQIIFEDKNLEELILSGKNSKYKKYARDKRFMEALARDYNVVPFFDSSYEWKNRKAVI